MIKRDRNFENFTFEEKDVTLVRKAEHLVEIQERESNKTGAMISDAVSASMLAIMNRYMRTLDETAERERVRLEELVKREEEKDLLLYRENRGGRRHSDSDSQLGASGGQFLTPRYTTETMMKSPHTFTTLFQSPPPVLNKPTHGNPIFHAEHAGSISQRSTTSEQQRLVKEVYERLSSNKSTQSEPGVEMTAQ